MIEPISRDKSTLYGGRGRQRKKNSKILLFVPTLLATIVAPQYMSDLFTNISQLTSHNLRNIATDLWFPQKRYSSGMKCFSYRGVKT